MYSDRHVPLKNGAVLMEISASHNTSFAMVKPIASMAVMKSVNFHHASPCQQCFHAKIKVNVWVPSISVMAFRIVTMAVTKQKVYVKTVHRMGFGFVSMVKSVCFKEKSVMVPVTVMTTAMSFPVFATIVLANEDSGPAKMVSNA